MMEENKEIWVFLSHSHKDYVKVSLVRNILEERGYRPIMFYLRCLDDNSEIDNLIKREIDCRAYFILCDSKNSRLSTWVREEESYIKSKGRIYEIIDIESDVSQIKAAVSRFERRTSAFISCSLQDLSMAHVINTSLQENGYTTFELFDGHFGTLIDIDNAITKYSNEGFVVILLSPNYLKGKMCLHELQLALGERCTNISSVLLVSIDGAKPYEIPELKGVPVRWIDASNCSKEQVAKKIISFFDFYNSCYRRVYNLCWELSRLDSAPIGEINAAPYLNHNNTSKTMIACRLILGLGGPTDIEYAIQLLREASSEGDKAAAEILDGCRS